MEWTYNGNIFNEPEKWYGFVYLITNNINGKLYIGKKFFTKAGYKQVNKKRKKLRKESDWKLYFGSNKELQEDVKNLGSENFKREIIRLCKNRSECGYYEAMEIMTQKALENDLYYNDWVSFKITKKHVKSFKEKN